MTLFKKNPGFEMEMALQPLYRAGLKELAIPAEKAAREYAEQVGAPWMPRQGRAEQIALVEHDNELYLVNFEHGGHLVEWGSVNNPPHAVLRRAVRAAGLRLDED